MRKIYVAMEALRDISGHPDTYLGYAVSGYARPFLTWATTQGTVVLLTDEPLSHAKYLLNKLSCSDKVLIRGFEVSKTEVLRHDEDFYLVDDVLIPGESAWFSEHSLGSRLVTTPPGQGVTQATKQSLEAKMRPQPRK